MASINKIEYFRRLVDQSENIVALTGAGISTNAGIPDFRGPQGLYVTKRYDPDIIFDITYFKRDPKPFFEFARDFIRLEETITPTAAHFYLAELERQGKLKGIITQNIDALHQKAGSNKVYEIHGSIWHSRCMDCQRDYNFELMKQWTLSQEVPFCECGGVIKPDIVFFGESVKYFEESVSLCESADLFLIIGTSCVVEPAASLPGFVSGSIVIINGEELRVPLLNVEMTIKEDIEQFFINLGTDS